jgi:hypothetical protein
VARKGGEIRSNCSSYGLDWIHRRIRTSLLHSRGNTFVFFMSIARFDCSTAHRWVDKDGGARW